MKHSLASIGQTPTVWRNDRFWLAGDHVVDPRTYEQPRVRELMEGMEQAKKSFKMTENQGSNVRRLLSLKSQWVLICSFPKVHYSAYRIRARACRARDDCNWLGFSFMLCWRGELSGHWSWGSRRDAGTSNRRDLVQDSGMYQRTTRWSAGMVHSGKRHDPLHTEGVEA